MTTASSFANCPATLLISILAAFATTTVATAQETQGHSDPVTATVSFPASQTSVANSRIDSRTESFTLPQFDPALGTLVSVQVRHTTNAAASVTLSQEIANTFHQAANATLTVATSMAVPGGSTSNALASRSGTQSVPGTGSVQLHMPAVPANSPTQTIIGANMAGYVGTGTVGFTMSQDYSQSVAGNVDFHYQFQGSVTSTMHVTYVYVSAAGASTWHESATKSVSYGLPTYLATVIENSTDTRQFTIDLPKFDPQNGTLTAVELHFTGSAGATCYYTPVTFIFGTSYANLDMDYTFELELPGSPNLTETGSSNRTTSFVNSSSSAIMPGWNYTSATRTVTGSALSSFIGTANLQLTMTQVFDQGFNTNRPVSWHYGTGSQTTVHAVYHYYNGVPATQVVRQGSPANTLQLRPGPTRPILGTTWEPFIDHTTLSTNPMVDVAMFGDSPANVPLPGLGTVLIDQVFASYLTATPTESFSLQIVSNPALIGLQVNVQGVSVGANFTYTLTNALDITLGEW